MARKILVSYRFSAELIAALKTKATAEQRSVTNLIEFYLGKVCFDKPKGEKNATKRKKN